MTRISSIYRQAHGPAPVGKEADRRNREAMREAWHKHGLAVLDPSDIDDDWIRQAVISEANRRYGRRTGDGQG